MRGLRWRYSWVASAIFLVELAIALWAPPGGFLRASIGDVLVIGLVYFCLRALASLSPATTGVGAVLIGFTVEGCQYLGLADRLHLAPGGVLYTALGSTFSVGDLVMYTIGGLVAVSIDRWIIARG